MTHPPIIYKAPAKLNLYLGVYPELDERGYHRVDSIMAAVNLYDRIVIEPSHKLSVEVVPAVDFPEETNSAYRAARAMEAAFGKSASIAITIHKTIPFKSGLGGASSDAAAVLKALCELWEIDIHDDCVLSIARSLGADMSFFLYGAPMLLKGAGDIPAESFEGLSHIPLVIIRPWGNGITAQEAYRAFDQEHMSPEPLDSMLEALRDADSARIAVSISNNLESVATRLMPELCEGLDWLNQQTGALRAMVTGSGSAIYSMCHTLEEAEAIKEKAAELKWWAFAGHIIEEGPTREYA